MLDCTVDEATYAPKNTALSKDISIARAQYQELTGDEFNIETAIDLACLVLQNAAGIWFKIIDVNRCQRLQRALFPDGLVYDQKTGFGTSVNT